MAQSFINRADLPLGIRNNNAGNLRPLYIGIWEGQIGTNGGFAVFEDMGWGVRAFATNLYTSINKRGTDTLRKYIERYLAGEPAQNVNNYLNYVTSRTGIKPDDKIPTDIESIKKLLRAQFEMENGKKNADLITDDDIEVGLSRLRSDIASFFNATKIYVQNFSQPNNKTIRYTLIGGILIAISIYSYFIYKKRFIK
jgi:hypothetical protein